MYRKQLYGQSLKQLVLFHIIRPQKILRREDWYLFCLAGFLHHDAGAGCCRGSGLLHIRLQHPGGQHLEVLLPGTGLCVLFWLGCLSFVCLLICFLSSFLPCWFSFCLSFCLASFFLFLSSFLSFCICTCLQSEAVYSELRFMSLSSSKGLVVFLP